MDSQVQQIKDKLSINEVVGQYVQLKRSGQNWSGRCPFHKEKTPSFYVSPDRGTYMCFGCGEKGDIFSFVEKMEGVDFPTALKQLAERAGIKLERQFTPNPQHVEKDEKLRQVCEEATKFFQEKIKTREDILAYLHSRGVTDETISAWRLGYAPASWEDLSKHLVEKGFSKNDIADAGLAAKSDKKPGEIYDRFRGRIMFPIADANGRVIAFSGRFFEKVEGSKEEGDPAKYVNSPETDLFKKSRVLYGLDKAKPNIRKLDCILLVEGQFDVVLAHQSGLPFAVALSGTALTPEHLSILGRLSKRLVLALDADAAGIRAGLKSAVMALSAGFDVKVPSFPEGKDPADVAKDNPELLKAAVRTSKTAVEFFLEVLRPHAKDERAYKKLVETQVLPLIAAIGSRIDQEHFVRIVANKLGISEEAVRAEVAKTPKLSNTPPEELEAPLVTVQKEEEMTSLERNVGLLLFYFENDTAMQEKLSILLGQARRDDIKEKLLTQAENWRFKFENELGENATAQTLAQDLLKRIEIILLDEQLFLARDDMKRISELARRKEELRK